MKRNGIPSPKTVARKGYSKTPKAKTDTSGASVLLMFLVAGTLAALVQCGII